MFPCPSHEQLIRLLSEDLPAAEHSALTAHVERCADCQQTLERLTEDPVVRPASKAAGRAAVGGGTFTADTIRVRGSRAADHPEGEKADEITRLGQYDVLGVLGRGGMGVVYKARQVGLDRVVALKVIKGRDLAGPAERARFRREAEAVARLRHPNIVQIHEVGEAGGLPYFCMEYVEGGTLAARIGGKPQPPRAAAELVVALARAVHHAHEQGVIHRDLKPANVLLTADGVPRIADFGLAKQVVAAAEEPPAHLTESGAILGTPGYMSPEQSGPATGRGQAAGVGPATDVYGLGAILYALLTGRAPFEAGSPLETILEVLNRDPTPIRRLRPEVPRDLETICLKCLRKQPHKRYPSAAALAGDLQRWLAGEPIQARPVGAAERAWLWARREPVVAGLLAAVAVVLISGLVVSTYFGLSAREQAAIARGKEEDALAAEKQARAEKDNADLRAAELAFRLGLQHAEAGAVDRGLFLMLAAWRQAPEHATAFRKIIRANLAGWSRQLPRLRQAFAIDGKSGNRLVAFGDPEERTLLTWPHEDGAVLCWDAATGEPVGQPLRFPQPGTHITASPSGRWLGVGIRGGNSFVFDRATGQAAAGVSWPHLGWNGPDFHDLPDVVRSQDPARRFWDLGKGGELLPGRLRQSFDDAYVLTRTVDGRVVLLVFRAGVRRHVEAIDLSTAKTHVLGGEQDGKEPPSLAGGPCPAISHDGRMAMQFRGDSVTWWDLQTGQPTGAPWKPRRRLVHFSLVPDGLAAFSLAVDDRLRQYDLPRGLQRGGDVPAPRATSAAFSHEFGGYTRTSDGRLVLTLDDRATVRVWDTSLGSLQATATANPLTSEADLIGTRMPPDADHPPPETAFSPDRSRVVVSWRTKNFAVLLDTRTGELLGPPLPQPDVMHLAFSADGRYLATATYQSRNTPTVILRDGKTGKPIGQPWTSPRLIHALSFSPDGKTLAVGAVGGTYVLDVPGEGESTRGVLPRHHLKEATCINGFLWNPDGRRLIARSTGGWPGVGVGLRLWDVWAGKPLAPFHPQGGVPSRVAWDGDDLLVCSSEDSALRRLSADAREQRAGPWDLGVVRQAFFSRDGRRIAASLPGTNVQQWDTRTGKPVGPLLTHHHLVNGTHYSSDGKVLAVQDEGRAVTLWDADTGWPLGPPLQHVSEVRGVAFADQDRTLLTVSKAGIVRAWPIPQPVQDDPDRFEAWMHVRGGCRLAGEETVQLTLQEWQEARRTFQNRWPRPDPALPDPPEDLAGWHRQRASDARETGNDRAELHHLKRLAELRPREAESYTRMAAIHARVAAHLPAGVARDREWQLAWAAAKRGSGRPGQEDGDRRAAMEAMVRRSHDEAMWHLDRLAARGGDWSVFADRAFVHAQRGNQKQCDADVERALARGGDVQREFLLQAADDRARQDRWPEVVQLLGLALKLDPMDLTVLHRLALAHLKAGDQAAYVRLCRKTWREVPPKASPFDVMTFSELWTFAPGAVDDWQRPLARMEESLVQLKTIVSKDGPQEQKEWLRWLTTQAALLHRAGRDGAIPRLNEAMKLAPGGEGGSEQWLWLALVHAAEKAPAPEVRRWLERARAGAPKRDGDGLWDAVLIEVLVAEASRALRLED